MTAPYLTAPTLHSQINGSSFEFSWDHGSIDNVAQWRLNKGRSANEDDYGVHYISGSGTSVVLSNLPVDGSTFYVELAYRISSSYTIAGVYAFKASRLDPDADPVIISPVPGSTLQSNIVDFGWSRGDLEDVVQWYIRAGSQFGGRDYYDSRITDRNASSHTIDGIPFDGSDVHVELNWRSSSGVWTRYNYLYTAGVLVEPEVYEPVSDAEYTEWKYDTTRNSSRVLLLEIGHSSGSLYLSSLPYLAYGTRPYDDWLISAPEIEDSLYNFAGIGDIDAINGLAAVRDETAEDWLSYTWRGYPCRWFFGDKSWRRDDFRQIASTLCSGIRLLDSNQYRFDLMDAGQHLNQTFATTDSLLAKSAKSIIRDVLALKGLPDAVYYNVELAIRNFRVSLDYDETTILNDAIKQITDSIGAYRRISQTGDVEIFIPDTTVPPDPVLTNDDISGRSIRLVDTVQTYKTVRLILEDGTPREIQTGAETGALEEVIEIRVLLYREQDILEALAYYANYYGGKHLVYEMSVYRLSDLLEVGNYIGVNCDELVAEGVISQIKRSPLSGFSTLELTT